MALPHSEYRPTLKQSDLVLRILLCGFVVILCRLFYIDVIRHSYFMDDIAHKLKKHDDAPTPVPGFIYARGGRNSGALAESVLLSNVVADPARILENHETFEGVGGQLEKLINRPATDIRDALERSVELAAHRKKPRKAHNCVLARVVSDDVASKVSDLKIKGLALVPQWKRVYHQGPLAAHLLGGRDRSHQPVSGLEEQYRLLLDGLPGATRQSDDPLGLASDASEPGISATPGKDLILTIDLDLQRTAEDALEAMWKHETPKWASVIVMDPRTGGILALASRPTYNPTAYVTGKPIPGHKFECVPTDLLKNIPVTEVVEPGSTFKILLTAAALDKGVITPSSTFHCPGHINVGGQPINCWGKYAVQGHGTLDVGGMLAQSCNVCAAQIALRLGAQNYYDFLRKCGLAQDPEAGFDIPSWALGILRKPAETRSRDLATMGFGQNVSCTALQLTSIVSGIVNGGVMKHPHVLDAVFNKDGTLFRQVPVSDKRVCSQQTSALIRQMMENTVLHGTGHTALMPGYRVGAKTGTAQEWDREHHRHYDDRYMVSFIETAPADTPRYVIYVACNEPHVGLHGSDVCGPVAKKIAEYALQQMDRMPASGGAAPAPPAAAAHGAKAAPAVQAGMVTLPHAKPAAKHKQPVQTLVAKTAAAAKHKPAAKAKLAAKPRPTKAKAATKPAADE